MTVKIFSLDWNTNREKSVMLARAGADYWRACDIIKLSNKNDVELFTWCVQLPLMHMTIELLLKAVVSYSYEDFSIKRYSHNTLKIINDYYERIEILKLIKENKEQMYLIQELNKAWHHIRYAESSFSFDESDTVLFEEITGLLYHHFLTLSKIRCL